LSTMSHNTSHNTWRRMLLCTKCQVKNKRKRTMTTTTTHLRPYESRSLHGSDFDCRVTTSPLQMKSCAQCSIDSKLVDAVLGGSRFKMAKCRYCSETIEWEEEEDFAGEVKWRPLDPLSGLPHRCQRRQSIYVPRTIKCYRCNQVITFSDGRVGRNGRKIPLNPSDMEAHRCPGT
jgi:hypothetical protein